MSLQISSPGSFMQSLRSSVYEVLGNLAGSLSFVQRWRARKAEHYFALAQKSYDQHQLHETIDHLNKAMGWSARKSDAYESLGVVYYELGEIENAKREFMLAILESYKLDGVSSLRALKAMGIIVQEEGNLSEAMYYYLKTQELPEGRSDVTVLMNLGGVLYDLGQYEESLKYSRRAEAIDPDNAILKENIGRAAYAMGDLATALSSLKRAAELNPSKTDLARMLSLVYRASGDTVQATEALQKVRDSGDPEALFDLSVLLEEQGHHGEAAETAGKAAELFRARGMGDREAAAYWQLGWCLYSLEDFSRSADASRKAVELAPALFAAQFNLGLALLLQGDAEGARQHYEAGMNAVREPSDIKYYAIADLEAAANKHPENPGFQPILEALRAKHAAMTSELHAPAQSASR